MFNFILFLFFLGGGRYWPWLLEQFVEICVLISSKYQIYLPLFFGLLDGRMDLNLPDKNNLAKVTEIQSVFSIHSYLQKKKLSVWIGQLFVSILWEQKHALNLADL